MVRQAGAETWQRFDSVADAKRTLGLPALNKFLNGVTPSLADGRDARVRAVAAGGGGTEGGHTAFLVETTRGDELYTCGYGRWGALGARAFSHIAGLRPVTTLASLREYDEALGRVVPLRILGVACGDAHTAAVLSSGNVFTWGWNDGGQLGDGGKAATHTPVMLKDLL